MSFVAGTPAMSEPIRKLAIVGASVRAAAFSALRAGYQVVAADLFADADLQRACVATRITGYPEALADWLAATDCDAWLYTGALENHAELISRMAKLRPLLGNGGEALREVRDPLLLQSALRDAGLAFPEAVDSPEGLSLDGSWLCKTYRGASGSGVWLLDGAAALERAEREQAVFQQFVGGVSAAAVLACSADGGQLLGVTRQLVGDAQAGAKPWHYAGSIGPLLISAEVGSQLSQLSDMLSKRFQLRGLVGVDLVITNNHAWLLEINPRYSSSVEIVERVTGISAITAHVAACNGITANPIAPSQNGRTDAPAVDLTNVPTHGKTILYAKRLVAVTAEFFAWAIAQASVDFAERQLADIPHAGEEIQAGHPVLTVFAAAAAKEYDSALSNRLREVESRLYSTT